MGNTQPRRKSLGSPSPTISAATRELERFTAPTGLYPSCPWDIRTVRRLILEKRIAPRFPGQECMESCFTQECPICFMYYPGNLNITGCCKKPICSECFLQLKPPRKDVCCPYCNHESLSVKYSAPAVINISSIYTDQSPSTTPDALSPSSSLPTPPLAQHFASVEDRERIRNDLRSQLNLTAEPLTTPPPAPPAPPAPSRPSLLHPPRRGSNNFIIASPEDAALLSHPRYFIATAEDAARLEEMMLLEAIRRSMRDVTLAKDDENEEQTEEPPQGQPQRRPSSNPFDEIAESAPPQRRTSWNPFDA